MFEQVPIAPPDPILGLSDAFAKDPNPAKINLSVGVYQDESGRTPIMDVVREARQRILASETSKSYKPITGDPAYGMAVQKLLFGKNDQPGPGRCATAHTPGGTGALRVAADYLHNLHPKSALWMSEPTWANHPAIFKAAGVNTRTYPYFSPGIQGLDFQALAAGLGKIPPGDTVLLHACCHNPTGADPTLDQWKAIAGILVERQLLPLVDFAYQGLGEGLEEDAAGLRILAAAVPEMLICSSFSKNFGLYNERVGALTLMARTVEACAAVISQVKGVIRTNYSNPPAHGGAIVATVLGDEALRRRWEEEVAGMRQRIRDMRSLFVQTLKAKGAARDFSFLIQQRGMFSFSGLTEAQVNQLKQKHAIYAVGSGRINVAGMTRANMDRLCQAMVSVL